MDGENCVVVHQSGRWIKSTFLFLGFFLIIFIISIFGNNLSVFGTKDGSVKYYLGLIPLFFIFLIMFSIIIWISFGSTYVGIKNNFFIVGDSVFSKKIGKVRRYALDNIEKLRVEEILATSKGLSRKIFQIVFEYMNEKKILLSGFSTFEEASSILEKIKKLRSP